MSVLGSRPTQASNQSTGVCLVLSMLLLRVGFGRSRPADDVTRGSRGPVNGAGEP